MTDKQLKPEDFLTILHEKKGLLFKRINRLYDLSKNISSFDSRKNESFMTESETIDDIRDKFESFVDQINQINISIKPGASVDYACLESFEDLYIHIKRVRNKINSNQSPPTPSSNSKTFFEPLKIKLPPIALPSFDGKTENWPVFYELFKSNIHDNDQLTDSQRVQYLVGRLTHNALKVTAGIVPTGDTYKFLWDSLVKKYQEKRSLGTHYLNNILDLKSCSFNANSLDSFIETFSASISALKQLGITDLADFILLHCAMRKINSQTIQSFELSIRDIEIPTTKLLISFVQDQAKILARSNESQSNARNYSRIPASAPRESRTQTKAFVVSESADSSACSPAIAVPCCAYCNDNAHVHLYNCAKYKSALTPRTRFEFIKSKRGCANCLSTLHGLSNCKSTSVCDLCKKRHHTLLHFDKENKPQTADVKAMNCNVVVASPPSPLSTPGTSLSAPFSVAVPRSYVHSNKVDISARVIASDSCDVTPASSAHNSAVLFAADAARAKAIVLLSTAQVYARAKSDSAGHKTIVRCLIDNGSQNNLITTACCRKLNLLIIPLSNSFVKGVGSVSRPIIGYVHLDIESRVYPDQKYTIHALVVECITDQLPSHHVNWDSHVDFHALPLADLSWNIPGDIDIVLGAQLFPYIYLGNRVDFGSRAPPALLTTFGYVFMGDFPHNSDNLNLLNSSPFTALALNDLLQKFWELEEVENKRFLSPEETECENIFSSTVSRDDVGRYTVALPFSKDPAELGNSRTAAYRRLVALERKLRQSPLLRKNYNAVLKEYIDSGYLSQVDESAISDDGYYIPHHAVVRPDKPMPRIVLDASARTHTGLSLNDVLHIGPNLQTDLFILLINFRLFPIAINADIKQMYLRVGVPVDQRKYLRILFRFDEHEPVLTFAFNRLPFGLKSSPYIAMRTVRQLASDSPHYPEAAKVAETSLYMDDLVYSVNNEDTAMQLSHDLIKMFKSGDFDLIKWCSNSPVLLNSLPDSHRKSLDFHAGSDVSKVLGLSWEPSQDNFFFTSAQVSEKCTKRNILSIVARLFDVLGLVAPVIFYAKLLIKELWLSNIGWDDPAPGDIFKRFSILMQEFPLLDTLRIPRHVGVTDDCSVRIVAFADASMGGYGCVIYIHSTGPSGVIVRLLCAKSKVSPTKVTTLARLELCAAVLMSKLVKTVRDTYALRIPIAGIYAFSDSTIALSWIHSSPHRWSVFVSNRVAQCQENLGSQHFYHVAGVENPSDCLSRGILPSQLMSHELWWDGPSWLRCAPEDWPVKPFSPINCGELPEHKANVLTVTTQVEQPLLYQLAQRTSSWDKLLRIVSYILKFARPKVHSEPRSIQSLSTAERAIVCAVQSVHFANDIKLIKSGKLLSKRLQSLAVFLDKEGILRIGGRLSKSHLPFDAKHPFLLPKHDHIVDLIIRHYHVMNCHTGPGLLMSILRQRFWILDARTVIRSKLRQCNTCFRVNPMHPIPVMADLPEYRVSEAKAFVHTGVDYAGPIRITLTRRRGQHAQKAYICLFVCLVTKAVHVELVSDLTSDAFLAAFKRFISRRGPVSYLYSDNATNFVGAKAQLDELYRFLLNSSFNSSLLHELSTRRIMWKMIPPRSPHFGAMWEANVKTLKTHLYRVIGSQLLTYEELQTVLIQIECIMNSRPLSVLSSDPHPEVITPAHFLMSTPLQYLPAADLSGQRINLSQRKQLLDSMVQSFWKKWHLEYLHTLQVRQKWATPDKPVEVGTVVLVGQDNSAPLSWPLGVITEVYKGTDNVVRVAMVKTKFGNFKRAVAKLYPIPTQ